MWFSYLLSINCLWKCFKLIILPSFRVDLEQKETTHSMKLNSWCQRCHWRKQDQYNNCSSLNIFGISSSPTSVRHSRNWQRRHTVESCVESTAETSIEQSGKLAQLGLWRHSSSTGYVSFPFLSFEYRYRHREHQQQQQQSVPDVRLVAESPSCSTATMADPGQQLK